jgi:isopenicillin N synthase-like dioxygenase
MLDKLNPEITYKLLIKLVFVLKTNSSKAFIVLTNSHVSLNLINHIFTANKQLFSLENKRAKAIKGN